MDYLQRFAENRLQDILADTPVAIIAGPRQSGKTTLVKHIAGDDWRYLTLDDPGTLGAALDDPLGLLRAANGPMIVDEIQRAPGLLPVIKMLVDEKRQPGRFIITGSADILALPRASESLAGRSEVVTLLPLSQAEIERTPSDFVGRAFVGKVVKNTTSLDDAELVERVLTGGYPEVLSRKTARRRKQWCQAYIQAILRRDIKDISQIHKAQELPRLMAVLASYSSQLMNQHDIGSRIDLDGKTANSYITALEQLFLVQRLPAWHDNSLRRLIKKPKLHFNDPAILASLLEVNAVRLASNRNNFGKLLETFVFSELCKQISWQEDQYQLSHLRDKDKIEIDFIVENTQSELVAIEVKAAATALSKDFAGLRKLQKAVGGRLKLGLLLYAGDQVLPFGPGLIAAPVSCLWR